MLANSKAQECAGLLLLYHRTAAAALVKHVSGPSRNWITFTPGISFQAPGFSRKGRHQCAMHAAHARPLAIDMLQNPDQHQRTCRSDALIDRSQLSDEINEYAR